MSVALSSSLSLSREWRGSTAYATGVNGILDWSGLWRLSGLSERVSFAWTRIGIIYIHIRRVIRAIRVIRRGT